MYQANAPAWALFVEHCNQWHAGMGGPYALNFEFFEKRLRLAGRNEAEIHDTIERLSVIEKTYLSDVVGERHRIDEKKREWEQGKGR